MTESNDFDNASITGGTNSSHEITAEADERDESWDVEDAMECLRQNFQRPPELDEAVWETLMRAAVQSSQEAADLIDITLGTKE